MLPALFQNEETMNELFMVDNYDRYMLTTCLIIITIVTAATDNYGGCKN